MKRPSIIAMGLLLIGLTVLGGAYVGFAQSGGGWVTLIDGATGLDNWNRDRVAAEKCVVPRKGSNPRNGFGSCSSQNAGVPPSSGLHLRRNARSGSLNGRVVCSLIVRFPTYETSIFESHGSSYWTPTEN